MQEQIAALIERIQSLSFVPEFSDCKATMYYTKSNGTITAGSATLKYEVRPAAVAEELVAVWEEAFKGCSSLTSVTIGNSVTSIGGGAFSGCTSLKEVYCKPTTPPTGNASMFDQHTTWPKIYVPRNSVEAYKAAWYWKDYAWYIRGYDF
ncbi:MAG: leucine-rich repeat protein [Alistipes sp.]|nr:leucine-rich repeat protein [Alistipes sp.]